MITLLNKIMHIKTEDPLSDVARQKYGLFSGAQGIFLNMILFGFKLFAGIISNSIAITADAFNNLSDASSSIVTIVGFKLSIQKPDKDHPFGHGRLEYVAGVIVSFLIILVGFELVKSSFNKIRFPEATVFSPLIAVILILSIFVKLYMAYSNLKISKLLDSVTIKAVATDSLNDCIATGTVLITGVISLFWSLPLDAYAGLLVGLFIIYSGINTAKDTINPLLGQPPTTEFVAAVSKTVLNHSKILGLHDLIVHDYGPGRLMLSLHAEVPSNENIFLLHDTIDNIERELNSKFNCTATIHLDPIDMNDTFTRELKGKVIALISTIYPDFTLHDFRTVVGPTHTNVLFDVVVPFTCNIRDEEIQATICIAITNLDATYRCVLMVDRSYV